MFLFRTKITGEILHWVLDQRKRSVCWEWMRRRPPSAEVRLGSGAGRLIRTTRERSLPPPALAHPPTPRRPDGAPNLFARSPRQIGSRLKAKATHYVMCNCGDAPHLAPKCTTLGRSRKKYSGFSSRTSWEWSQIALVGEP